MIHLFHAPDLCGETAKDLLKAKPEEQPTNWRLTSLALKIKLDDIYKFCTTAPGSRVRTLLLHEIG